MTGRTPGFLTPCTCELACEQPARSLTVLKRRMPNLPGPAANLGPKTLIQAEGQGRVTELTIDDNKCRLLVVNDGLMGATGVTIRRLLHSTPPR